MSSKAIEIGFYVYQVNFGGGNYRFYLDFGVDNWGDTIDATQEDHESTRSVLIGDKAISATGWVTLHPTGAVLEQILARLGIGKVWLVSLDLAAGQKTSSGILFWNGEGPEEYQPYLSVIERKLYPFWRFRRP